MWFRRKALLGRPPGKWHRDDGWFYRYGRFGECGTAYVWAKLNTRKKDPPVEDQCKRCRRKLAKEEVRS